MGIVTVSMEDELMASFRKAAAANYGRGKGYLKKALGEAIELWLKLKGRSPEADALLILEEGLHIGYKPQSRKEFYHERLNRY